MTSTSKGPAHSILPASSCERWWNCPGSVNACKNIPNPPNVYMAEGTVAHRLAEWCFKNRETNLDEYIGHIIEEDGFEIEVTEEMVDAVLDYRDYVLDVWEKNGCPPYKTEQKIELKEVNAVLFGTVDFHFVVDFRVLHVFDLKFGRGKRVSAWENKQLMEYALGVMLKEDVAECVLHVCQPRVEDGFSTYTASRSMMEEFAAELEVRSTEALKPDAPLVAGDWCKGTFCPYRVGCPALRELAKDLVARDFDAPLIVEKLSMEQIVKILNYEDVVKDWMAKVREHAKELMLNGEDVPGYKVVQSYGHAKWIDEDVIKAEFEDEFGDKLYQKKLISPAQLEKLAGKKRLGKDFRDDYTVRPENGFRIIKTEERGEPVKLTKAQEDFQ